MSIDFLSPGFTGIRPAARVDTAAPLALVVTADEVLLDEVLRLAAAAGARSEVADGVAAALRSWAAASVVLVGADLAEDLARAAPPRRGDVHVVGWGRGSDEVYRTALNLGAEDVVELPDGADWLAALLTDLGEAEGSGGVTVGVVGGSGGAGATTFAVALAQLASRSGPVCLVDLDPLGPGCDRVLGLDEAGGVHWEELGQTSGRFSARSLREALPRRGRVGVLTWAGDDCLLDPAVVRETLSAAGRGHRCVVVDLPRTGSSVTDEVLARCDEVVVLVVPTVSGVASATRVIAQLADRARPVAVARGGGVDPGVVQSALGVPVLLAMPDQRGLDEAVDLGLGPLRARRGHLAQAATAVAERLLAQGRS